MNSTFTDLLKSLSMADNPGEEMMEVDGAIGGEQENSFEGKKAMLVELERAGVEGVEDMMVEKCPACGFAWIDQLPGFRSRWICRLICYACNNVS